MKDFENCDHAYWEHNDIDERGYCPDCGATCDWHYEKDFDGEREYMGAEPIEWHAPGE